MKILVTRRWPEQVEEALQARFDVTLNPDDEPLTKRALQEAMSQYDVLCPCVADKIGADVLGSSDLRVKLIANYGVGYDHIDVQAARANGISVTNTPDVLTDSTADLAMTLMLMVARRAGEGERQLRRDEWQGWYPTHMMGSNITGATLGIIGLGRIGLGMAQRAHHGFDMPILYHNRKPLDETLTAPLNARFCAELEELLAHSDFVALHCPGGENTRHIVNAERLRQMKPSAYLINTSRGNVVDEDALITALQKGWIAGAGLDVYEREPVVPAALKAMENVVLLPHLGSATTQTRVAMGMRALDNIQAFADGQTPVDRVV